MFGIVLISIIAALLTAAAKWRIFQKMGFEGWKSLIPFYNDYLMFKGVYGNGWVVLKVWLAPVAAFVATLALGLVAYAGLGSSAGVLAALAWCLALIVVISVMVKLLFDLAKSFGQSKAFGWGLLLCTPVFMIMLGLSRWTFRDGRQPLVGDDIISIVITRACEWLRGTNRKNNSGKNAISLLKELGELHNAGIIDDAVFEEKKAALLKRI